MSVDGQGFHVQTVALDEAAAGIREIEQDQDEFDLSSLCGSSEVYGHAGVHNALDEFCQRWSAGLTTLTDDCSAIAESLQSVAKAYSQVEHTNARSLSSDPGVDAVDG